ncbi:metallophosphoesterase family protein [Parabacteroides sp. TM07-1AC]|nr:metallophosphoesterase family protein [Parabacteroides sp. TM07-1AC]
MNRKEFLRTSGLLLPVSFLGVSGAEAIGKGTMKEVAETATGASYLDSATYKAHADKLKFNADGKFKIVQFTDVHWVPGNPASEEAAECMNEVLDAEKPDFVIYTGDIVFAKPAAEGFRKAFEPVISRNLPFAVTLGNHDDEHDMSRQEIYAFIKDMPGSLTGTVEGLNGVTNFILPIQSSKGAKEAFILYGFDSLAYSRKEETKGYDWIKSDQIDWYRKSSAALTAKNSGKPLPALAFFHIPVPEYNQAASDENTLLIGIRKEKACAPVVNSGLFTAMLEAGDVMATFVGHDHVNDYVANWKGILLGYGRFTGGKTVYHDVPGGNGARVFELTEGSRSFKSWIRLKDDKVISSIHYPADFVKGGDSNPFA